MHNFSTDTKYSISKDHAILKCTAKVKRYEYWNNIGITLKHVNQYIADPVFETEKNIRCCMIDLWCIVQIIHYKSIKIEIFITGSIHKFQICDERQAWIRIMITSNNVWFSNQRKMMELMSQNEHPKLYLTFWF